MGLRVFGRRQASADIDLRDRLREHIPGETEAAAEPTPAEHRDGYPDDCPRCGGVGYLDRIDIVNRQQWQHCRSCKTTWSAPID